MPFLRQPPSAFTGEAAKWLSELCRVMNQIPNFSYFSGTTPNSTLTGGVGDLAINVGSASTSTRLWVQTSSVPSITSWVTLRTGPA